MIYLQDRFLYTAFLDRNFCIIKGGVETFKDPNKESSTSASANLEKALQNKVFSIFKFYNFLGINKSKPFSKNF